MARAFTAASSQYLHVLSSPVSTHPLTVAAWFNPANVTSAFGLVMVCTTGTTAHRVELRAVGTAGGDPIRLVVAAAGAEAFLTTSTGYTANTWHHACAVLVNATDRSVFLDGGGKGTSSDLRNISGMNRVEVGRRHSSTSEYMEGRIAEVAIWNVALSDAEVLLLAQRHHPLRMQPGALVGYWPLRGAASEEPDFAGGVRNLTLNNGPVAGDHVPLAPMLLGAGGWQSIPTISGGGGGDSGPPVGSLGLLGVGR